MQFGMIGLGRMGANMARRLMTGGHRCVAHDTSREALRDLEAEGATAAASLDAFSKALERPRTAWIMVPAGAPTEKVVAELAARFERGDTIVDGGNTYFKDDIRRSRSLAEKGIDLVDVGTSGGVWGLKRGYCLMIGGAAPAVKRLGPIFATLAPGAGDTPRTPGREARRGTADEGWLHCGPSGAGHFVKMIHNGVEYGIMQAYAEGFELVQGAGAADVPAEERYDIDVADVAELWRRGSVVGSWLLDLSAIAFAEDPKLSEFTGSVPDSGEGRWTVQTAVERGTSAPVLTEALYRRFRSRQASSFGEKVLSALRAQFGGHSERPGGAR